MSTPWPRRRASIRVRLVVVGAGAGGVEVALASTGEPAKPARFPEVTLLEAARDVLPGYATRVRRRAGRILGRRGVTVMTGAAVSRVERDAVHLASGVRIAADLVVWLTGATGPGVLERSGLPLDDQGSCWSGPRFARRMARPSGAPGTA